MAYSFRVVSRPHCAIIVAMGTTTSKVSPLAPAFERMTTWDIKAARQMLQDYKDKDLDFGLDAQGLGELLRGDKEWAESIIDAFGSSTGIVNALAFVCGACLVSSGPALEKTEMIFDALDFDGTEQISMDEMTIAFLCCARGFCVIAGVGIVPSDEDLESVTLQAYRDLNKGSAQSISKAEFTKWVIEFASGTGAPPTREVTLQNALEQFRVVPPVMASENDLENNTTDLLKVTEEPIAAEHHDEAVQADTLRPENLPAQETQETEASSENSGDVAVEQSDPNQQTAEISALSGAEHVPTEVDEQPTNSGDTGIDDQGKSPTLEAETSGSSSMIGGGEYDMPTLQGQTDDLMNQGDEAADTATTHDPEQQVAYASNDFGIDVQECQETTVSTEDDDHSDVVGIDDEPPQNSAAPVDDTRIQNVPAEEEIGELVAPLDTETTAVFDQQHNVLDGQEVDAEAALAEIAQAEAPQEPLAIEGGEDEEDTYEQDFAQETPQETPRPVDDVCPDQSVENDEFTDERDLGAATDMLKPTLTEGANGITTQDINESGAGVNEDRIRTTTILQDSADDASNKQFDDTGVSLS